MPTAMSGGSRIRTNTPAENAYNALQASTSKIANAQLRLSTGKRINSAADDVSGYITSRALSARNSALKQSLSAVGEGLNVTAITQDALDNINGLLQKIKDAASIASSGALGTDEKVSLAKGAYRLAQQIQFVVDSTVFGGKQLLQGGYSGSWTIGYYGNNNLLTIGIDLTTGNVREFNVSSTNSTFTLSSEFNLNATSAATAAGGNTNTFAGVSGFNLECFNNVSATDLGIFGTSSMVSTLTSLSTALNNINKVASYLGGIQVRLTSQEDLLNSQITNFNSAISRIEDADVATEQLELVKQQFLQQTSLISLAQANQAPQTFLQLFG